MTKLFFLPTNRKLILEPSYKHVYFSVTSHLVIQCLANNLDPKRRNLATKDFACEKTIVSVYRKILYSELYTADGLTQRVASLRLWFRSPQEEEFLLSVLQSIGIQPPI
jgi:hypothetical protein